MTDMPNPGYDDSAVAIAGAVEIPVRARLRRWYSERGEHWGGTLAAATAHDFVPLHETNGELVLRTADGREARFTVKGEIANPLSIRGDNLAPF
jgi:hypothetical protein